MSSVEDEATKQGNSLRDKGDFDGAIAAYTEGIRLQGQVIIHAIGPVSVYLRLSK